jgi:hypothetical protein
MIRVLLALYVLLSLAVALLLGKIISWGQR